MKNILIFGDSNTWGYNPETGARLTEAERWPALVRARLGEGYFVIEDGMNGRLNGEEDPDTPYRNGLKGLQMAMELNSPLDLVVIQMGVNNLKDFLGQTPEEIAAGAERLVRECAVPVRGYPAPKVLLIAPAPVSPRVGELLFGGAFGPRAYEKGLRLGPLYREAALRNGCGFIDCADLHLELHSLDGLHYTRADCARLAPAVTAAVREMLEG